jgi:hypothetical protein
MEIPSCFGTRTFGKKALRSRGGPNRTFRQKERI